MNKILDSTVSALVALVGIIGGAIWAALSNWDLEPIILIVVAFIQMVAFIFRKSRKEQQSLDETAVPPAITPIQTVTPNPPGTPSREMVIESMKPKVSILFIDDDKNFNVVKILKDSGWRQTKTVIDIKSIDTSPAKDADIFFVDINGVGRLLKLEYEGLDLAFMLKQRYPKRKVILYSANKSSNSFHKAWDICDYKLEKNALPYQFQNLVEEISIEMHESPK